MFKKSLLSICACVSMGVCLMAVTAADNKDENTDGEIHELMVERRDALRERAKAVLMEHRHGHTPVNRVLAAQNDLIAAELELAESKQQRIKLRTDLLSNLTKIEKFARLSFENGTGTTQEKLEAKAARILGKIELLREQRSN